MLGVPPHGAVLGVPPHGAVLGVTPHGAGATETSQLHARLAAARAARIRRLRRLGRTRVNRASSSGRAHGGCCGAALGCTLGALGRGCGAERPALLHHASIMRRGGLLVDAEGQRHRREPRRAHEALAARLLAERSDQVAQVLGGMVRLHEALPVRPPSGREPRPRRAAREKHVDGGDEGRAVVGDEGGARVGGHLKGREGGRGDHQRDPEAQRLEDLGVDSGRLQHRHRHQRPARELRVELGVVNEAELVDAVLTLRAGVRRPPRPAAVQLS